MGSALPFHLSCLQSGVELSWQSIHLARIQDFMICFIRLLVNFVDCCQSELFSPLSSLLFFSAKYPFWETSRTAIVVSAKRELYPGAARTDCCAMLVVVVNHCIVSSVACRVFARADDIFLSAVLHCFTNYFYYVLSWNKLYIFFYFYYY